MGTKQTDKQTVLAHLRYVGPITPLVALENYGILRLGARVWDLRHDGHEIKTERVTGTDRYGNPMRYARYTLTETAQ